MVSVAIMGHGVVGSGVAEILLTHKQKLFASLGEEVYIKKVLDLREFPDSPIADRFTKDFNDIINDLEIRVIVACAAEFHVCLRTIAACGLGKSFGNLQSLLRFKNPNLSHSKILSGISPIKVV